MGVTDYKVISRDGLEYTNGNSGCPLNPLYIVCLTDYKVISSNGLEYTNGNSGCPLNRLYIVGLTDQKVIYSDGLEYTNGNSGCPLNPLYYILTIGSTPSSMLLFLSLFLYLFNCSICFKQTDDMDGTVTDFRNRLTAAFLFCFYIDSVVLLGSDEAIDYYPRYDIPSLWQIY